MRLKFQIAALALFSSLCELTPAQSGANSLLSFFETRLSDNPVAKPPSYEKLLAVVDSIKSAEPSDIRSALPLIASASQSKIPNLNVEAVFAIFEISRRSDAGELLGDNLQMMMNLLGSNDERVRNGAAVSMRTLSQRIPDKVVPSLTTVLGQSRFSSDVKSEAFRAILESKFRSDPRVTRTLETYINASTDVNELRETLHAIAANKYASQGSINVALRSLDSSNEPLQISAIQALFVLGNDARIRAQPVWAKLAADTTRSELLRHIADQALRGTLAQPGKLPEPKSAPRLLGVP